MVALSRNISKKNSMEMLLTGDLIDSYKAKEFGLINRVVPEKKLKQTVNEIAEKILQKSSKTIHCHVLSKGKPVITSFLDDDL